MKVLVINNGSSSGKYCLYDMDTEMVIAEGVAERLVIHGGINAELTHRVPGRDPVRRAHVIENHASAVRLLLEVLTAEDTGVIGSIDDIDAIGHRVVHAGTKFAESALITADVIAAVEDCIELGPLHNPPNLAGIRACEAALPGVPQVAVFDTAFGQTLPPHAYHYAIPHEIYVMHGVRRYGFHGTSHRYITLVATKMLEARGIPREEQKLITCHLGNGCSMAAVKGGRCVDTSMGLTPLEGLVMGTRCGDIDPAAIPFIMEREGVDTDEIDDMLNKRSGLLGLSGVSSDMRDIRAAAASGDKRAQLAIDVFCYRIRKYIGAYAAALGGLHAVAFTAGIGENTPLVRDECVEGLEFMGLEIDHARNQEFEGVDEPADVSTANARARVLVIPTDEELMIARDTLNIVVAL